MASVIEARRTWGAPAPRSAHVIRLRSTAVILFAVTSLAPIAPTALLAQNPSNGPLTFEEGSPLHRVSYTPVMEDAGITARGAFRVDLALGFSNIFEQDSSASHVLFLDMERVISAVTFRWGAGDRLELGGRVLLESTGGGVLDGTILGWHERLGLGQANRDRFPQDQYAQRLTNGAGTTYLDVEERTLGFEDARLFGRLLVASSSDRRSVLSVRAEVRVPGDSNRAASERVDGAVSALARAGLGSWYLHTMLGLSTVRASADLDPILRGSTTFFTLALERSFGSISAVTQYQVQSPVLRSFDHREIDRSPTNLLFGLSGRIADRWRWDASFQEDMPADTPAIDFTLGLRVSRSF